MSLTKCISVSYRDARSLMWRQDLSVFLDIIDVEALLAADNGPGSQVDSAAPPAALRRRGSGAEAARDRRDRF